MIPSLIQTRTSVTDDDEEFDLILTSSKELAERPEIELWRGPIFVWDDVLRQMTSRDSWVLGHLVKTSLRLAKINSSISESPVINPRTLSRFMVPVPLDQKNAPLFSSSKAYLLVGGMSDLGVHFALWMYQVSGFLAPETAKSYFNPFLARCEEDHFDFSPWPQVPRH